MPMPVKPERGFTLVEVIVGLVVTGVALSILTAVLYPLLIRGLDPLFQIRAAELGHALMDEILAKPYDENTPIGGLPPCNDPAPGAASCTAGAALGSDGETRPFFDDVDDYDAYCGGLFNVLNANNNTPAGFDDYRMQICVDYDSDYDGSPDAAPSVQSAKMITLFIYPPQKGQPVTSAADYAIEFRAYRSNF